MIVIAACFYSPDDYKKLLEISDDRESMCNSYEDWLVEFMKMKNGMEEGHLTVNPVHINLDELAKFCIKNKLKNTGEARSKFANYLAKKLHNSDSILGHLPENYDRNLN